METLIKILLVLLYPLLMVARLLNTLLGRDPLRLRETEGDTCWIERGPEGDCTSYFSEVSEQEGRNHGGMGRMATCILCGVGRLFAPSRESAGKDFRAAAERELDIPDE